MQLPLSCNQTGALYTYNIEQILLLLNLKTESLATLCTKDFMDSSVCLLTRCSMISVPPFRVPATTVNTARTTRPNLRLQHASTSLPMGFSGRQPVRRLLTPVICSVEGVPTPPTNKKDDGNILIRALMAFAGTAFGALVGNFMTKQKTDNSPETSMNGSSRHGDMDQPAVAKVLFFTLPISHLILLLNIIVNVLCFYIFTSSNGGEREERMRLGLMLWILLSVRIKFHDC